METGFVSGLLIYDLHYQGLLLPSAMVFAVLKFQINGYLSKNMETFI
jgi:hypothetical protein